MRTYKIRLHGFTAFVSSLVPCFDPLTRPLLASVALVIGTHVGKRHLVLTTVRDRPVEGRFCILRSTPVSAGSSTLCF